VLLVLLLLLAHLSAVVESVVRPRLGDELLHPAGLWAGGRVVSALCSNT
jgi:hypothetical protein